MNVYYVVLGVIVALCAINLATLTWVYVLQKRLTKAHQQVSTTKHAEEIERMAMRQAVQQVQRNLEASAGALLQEMLAGLQRDLSAVGQNLRQHVDKAAGSLVDSQLSGLEVTMQDLNSTLTKSVQSMQAAVDAKRQELQQALQADLSSEKAKVMAEFDARLSDVVAGYLHEILANEVDLGAQSQYLFKQLEAHKAELKAEIDREASTA